MQIKISSAEEFERLLKALCEEVVNACIHFRLYSDLEAAKEKYSASYIQSWTFWSLTFQAHLDTALFRLCKIYDQHDASLNLRNLLDTIEANLAVFDTENFRERLKGNPFVDSLSKDAKRPNVDDLKADKNTVCEVAPPVKTLLIWRNNFFAHRSAKLIVEKKSLADRYSLEIRDVDGLCKNALRIVNHYSSLFRAEHYSTQMVGHRDFEYVLKTVDEAVQAHEARINHEMDELQKRSP